jgi:hypothetical protein
MRLPFALLLLVGSAFAQVPEPAARTSFFHDQTQMTAAGFAMTMRVADLAQTIYHMDQSSVYDGTVYHGRETWLPTQNKGVISAALLGSGVLTTFGQYRLYRNGHKRTAIAVQLISAAVSGLAISRSFHSTYTVEPRKMRAPR